MVVVEREPELVPEPELTPELEHELLVLAIGDAALDLALALVPDTRCTAREVGRYEIEKVVPAAAIQRSLGAKAQCCPSIHLNDGRLAMIAVVAVVVAMSYSERGV